MTSSSLFLSTLSSWTTITTFALGASLVVHATPILPPKHLVARSYNSSDMYANWPTYDQLPLHPSFPTKAAWGVWVSLSANTRMYSMLTRSLLGNGRWVWGVEPYHAWHYQSCQGRDSVRFSYQFEFGVGLPKPSPKPHSSCHDSRWATVVK